LRRGRDTIYVRGGTFGPVTLVNLWPSEQVLITNYPGENPVFDGWNSVVDYGAVLALWRTSNFAIQGLTIRNTGVPDAEHGGYGLKVSESTEVKIYFNTVHDTARHGILTDGHQMEVVGNEVYNAVMRNRWFESNYWDGGIATGTGRNQWGYKLVGNSVHDIYGECVDVMNIDGATVEGNKIYNCVSANLFVSSSRNVTLNRNWIYANTDRYNRPTSATAQRGSPLETRHLDRLVAPERPPDEQHRRVGEPGPPVWRAGRADPSVTPTETSTSVSTTSTGRSSRPCASTLRTEAGRPPGVVCATTW
jgi:hypothetical protein